MRLACGALGMAAVVAGGLLLGGLALAGDGAEAERLAKLAGVRTWHYQLQRLEPERMRESKADLLVIDYARWRPPGPLTRADVEGLKRKPDGGPRVVLAYLSIGEAEDYRYYWQQDWHSTPPPWLVGENCEWRGNYLVRFWDAGWMDIVLGGGRSYLARIQEAGFDGIYLDRIDAYRPLQKERSDARAAMIDFVKRLAATARARDPSFLVFPQNADTLLGDGSYLDVIDGIGRESLILRGGGMGAHDPDDIRRSIQSLKRLSARGKPVLVVEYPWSQDERAAAEAQLAPHGFVYSFATRALDGRDPLAPQPISDPVDSQGPQPSPAPQPDAAPAQRQCLDY